jgi:nickel/cobalt exporter
MSVFAHPADEARQEVVFAIRHGQLTWTHDLWLGPLIGMQTWSREIDSDGDGVASSEEQQAYVNNLCRLVELRVDGKPAPMTLNSFYIAPQEKFVAQPAQPQVVLVFSTPISAGKHILEYRTMIDPIAIKPSVRFPSGGGTLVENAQWNGGWFSAGLVIKPIALEQSGDDDLLSDAASTPSIAELALSPAISGLIEGSNLSPWVLFMGLVVSFAVGAAHALTPGHGKGIIAAYMVGGRGRMMHAVTLALTMTITHTSSVIVLGMVALLASRVILPQVLTPWLTLASGVLILVVGSSLLWRRLHEVWHAHDSVQNSAEHTHNHTDGHDHSDAGQHHHDNAHNHDHSHADDPEHTHTHDHAHQTDHVHGLASLMAARSQVSWRALIVLGISGGLLPCADALAILLLSVSVNRIALGVVLLVAFSTGIALTLTLIGILAAAGQRVLKRYDRLQPLLLRLPLASAAGVGRGRLDPGRGHHVAGYNGFDSLSVADWSTGALL